MVRTMITTNPMIKGEVMMLKIISMDISGLLYLFSPIIQYIPTKVRAILGI